MLHEHKEVAIPCDGCIACCQDEIIFLKPEHGDRPQGYRCMIIDGKWALARKPNGDCTYLGEGGCTIHERRPSVCRMTDCRRLRKIVLGFMASGKFPAHLPKFRAMLESAERIERLIGKVKA